MALQAGPTARKALMAFILEQGDRPTTTLVATLDHLAIESGDPARLADYYRRAMGYRIEEAADGALIARAPDRALIVVPGTPKTLRYAGYRLPDLAELERLCERIRAAGIEGRRAPTELFADAVEVSDPAGNRLVFGLPRAASAEPSTQVPAARIQHIVVASRDPESVCRFFQDLGFTLSDDVVDEEGGVRTSFLRCSHEHHSFAVFKAAEDRLDHHCYETVDWNAIRDWGDHMASEEIPIQWGPGRHGPGNNLFLFVHDPDGNWVELSAELEIVAHDRPIGKWPHTERTLNSWGKGFLRS